MTVPPNTLSHTGRARAQQRSTGFLQCPPHVGTAQRGHDSSTHKQEYEWCAKDFRIMPKELFATANDKGTLCNPILHSASTNRSRLVLSTSQNQSSKGFQWWMCCAAARFKRSGDEICFYRMRFWILKQIRSTSYYTEQE